MGLNYLAILVCGIVAMVIGSLWYGPLFGSQWMRLRGLDPSTRSGMRFPAKQMIIQFIASLVMSWVLAALIVIGGVNDVVSALFIAFLAWIGFQATTQLHGVLWDKQSWKLFVLNIGQQLVTMAVIAVILGLWH